MVDVDYFKRKLEQLEKETRKDIERSKESSEPVTLDQTMVGRVSRIDAIQQQEMALAIKSRRLALLTQIGHALRRIEDGDYGYCISCDEEIPFKRLDLDPVATKCVHCSE